METVTVANVATVFTEIENGSCEVITVLICRVPLQPLHTNFNTLEIFFEKCSCETVIIGDFNLPVPTMDDPYNCHTGHDLYTNELESDFHQNITK